ncbi:hypothetical protein MNBD_GAMMA15-940 [hydrothermal vent metagenome]|uniref:Phosphonate ABC transporter phosphate-binding periplasmic component (TC 3.A.1.9.1) n=1 Tax=hydrothermal vent metagenome TaxID=652676 RepID=A0A3B0YK58_9ZZZZ
MTYSNTRFNLAALFALLVLLSCQTTYSRAEPSEPIRFGVLSIAPPARILEKWQPFADYMSERLGRPVKVVVPRGFGRMKEAVKTGHVDFFYVNSYVFYRLKQTGQANGIAQMQNLDGKTTSRSEIFVRSDSGISDLDGLEGKTMAYVSPMGAGGYLAPRAYLWSHGIESGKEVKEIFTKNLSSSIHKVLLNDIEAATMCGVNFRLMGEKVETGELKIIGVSDAYPENLIAARSSLDPQLIKHFKDVVLAMPGNPAGSEVLVGMMSMKIKEFVPYDPAMETITRDLIKQAGLKP